MKCNNKKCVLKYTIFVIAHFMICLSFLFVWNNKSDQFVYVYKYGDR